MKWYIWVLIVAAIFIVIVVVMRKKASSVVASNANVASGFNPYQLTQIV